jgi:hypothetical protein
MVFGSTMYQIFYQAQKYNRQNSYYIAKTQIKKMFKKRYQDLNKAVLVVLETIAVVVSLLLSPAKSDPAKGI